MVSFGAVAAGTVCECDNTGLCAQVCAEVLQTGTALSYTNTSATASLPFSTLASSPAVSPGTSSQLDLSPTPPSTPAASTPASSTTGSSTPSSSTAASSYPAISSATSAAATTPTLPANYQQYSGDGSVAEGWPKTSNWMSFDDLWAHLLPNIGTKAACEAIASGPNLANQTEIIREEIIRLSVWNQVPPAFALAIMM